MNFFIEDLSDDIQIKNLLENIDYELFDKQKIKFIKKYNLKEHRALDDAKLNGLLLNYFFNIDK